MSQIRVGLVSPYDLSVPGGVQAQVLGLARYLSQQGDHTLVIGPGLPAGVRGVDLGATISIPGNGSKVPLSLDPRTRHWIRSAVLDLDLLHVHEPLMPLVSLFANHAGPPVIGTFHAAPGPAVRFGYRFTRPLLRLATGNTVALSAVSETAASVLGPGAQIRIIPNGIEVAALQSDVARNTKRIAFLGRDEPRKGLGVLLDAWDVVRARHPDAELTVMGAERDRSDVTWMGRVDDRTKARVLNSSAIFVAPQLGGESFGIVLLEAMAAGAAVVASDLESFKSVANGAAVHFPVGDSVALASALGDLLSDPDRREVLAASGQTRAAEYDWDVVGPRYRDLYVSQLP